MKFLFLCYFTLITSFFHADGLAEFTYYLEQNQLRLKVEIDNTELQHYIAEIGCSNVGMADLCVAKYLLTHSSLKLNKSAVVFEYESSSVYNGHKTFYFKAIHSYTSNVDIQIRNNCFLEVNSTFKNRVLLLIKEIQKSFLLTKDKQIVKLP